MTSRRWAWTASVLLITSACGGGGQAVPRGATGAAGTIGLGGSGGAIADGGFGVSTLHFEMARDEWSFLSERVGNNGFREIGLTAPCSNSATITINGQFYGLYVAEEGITKSLLAQFFPGNADGDLLKGGTEAHTNIGTTNWTKVQTLDSTNDIGTLRTLVDVPNTLLEWAAEAVVEDADGYYGGSHNFWIYDQGTTGYVWLLDHTDSALEWLETFTPTLGYKSIRSTGGPGEHCPIRPPRTICSSSTIRQHALSM